MPKEVSFVIRLDDKGTFKKVTVDAEELGRAVRSVQDESEKAKRTIISWSEVSQAFDVLQNAISELQGVMTDLTSAYQVQLVAETQLQTIMRQRMGANDEMIQSVKDLCSAQQELGVIGDEVQLSGAQQMATFLKSKQSLDVLIPAMNNLIAQQNGLNATNQDAVSIGNMMGKAMQGQVEVLQRVGITFTDAQKQVLQFGTESERAAMLAQVITDNVGNMNAELAKTDAGKWKQTENYLGDIKEQLGAMVQQYAPTITFLSQATIAASGIGKLATSFYSVGKAMGITKAIAVAWNAVCSTLSSTGLRLNAIIKVCSATMRGAAVSANTLKLAIQGLMISTGVGIAIVTLTEAISAFMAKSDAAKLSAEEMADGMKSTGDAADDVKEAYDSSLKSTYSDLMAKYEKLKAGWKSLSTEQQKTAWIKQNQGAFHDLRLKINDVTEAENIFNKKTDAVVDAFKQRAMAAAYAAKLTALYQKQIALLDKKQKVTKDIADDAKRGGRNAKEGDLVPERWRNERYGRVGNDGVWRFSKVGAERYNGANTTGNKQIGGIDNELNSINRQIDDTQKQLKGRLKSAGNFIAADTPRTSTTPTKTTPSPKTDNTPKTHIEKLQDQLKKEQEKLGNATTIEAKLKASAKLADLQAQIDTETKGRLTIAADVEPSYIEQGSIADKRQSYSNAQTKASRIQQDFEIGIIGKDKAKKQIEDLNKQLAKLGKSVKPIKLDINSKDIAKIQSLFNIDVTNFDSVKGAFTSIQGIVAPTAKGLAAAGASCEMLGSAMQQLGSDSAAGKAGMIMAAIGQIVLSFAQALSSCKTWVDWLAFGISGTAQMISLIATVSKFATGGIVGGNQKSGDNVLVRVNSGEMILNAAQQARLFAIADGTAAYGASAQIAANFAQGVALPSVSVQTDRLQGIMADGGGNQPKTVEWRLRGRDIVASIANETRSNRKRSNIRIK